MNGQRTLRRTSTLFTVVAALLGIILFGHLVAFYDSYIASWVNVKTTKFYCDFASIAGASSTQVEGPLWYQFATGFLQINQYYFPLYLFSAAICLILAAWLYKKKHASLPQKALSKAVKADVLILILLAILFEPLDRIAISVPQPSYQGWAGYIFGLIIGVDYGGLWPSYIQALGVTFLLFAINWLCISRQTTIRK